MKKESKIRIVVTFILIFLAFVLFFIVPWAVRHFSVTSIDVLIFYLNMSLEGADMSNFYTAVLEVFAPALLCTGLVFFPMIRIGKTTQLLTIKIRNKIIEISLFPSKRLRKHCLKLSVVFFTISFFVAAYNIGVFTYIRNQILVSTIFEDEYVDPNYAQIIFPDEPRNLIIIYLESMENTFASKEHGGAFAYDLIPYLTRLNRSHTSFSHNEQMGGAQAVHGTGWTTAGLVASVAGIPIKVPINTTELGNQLGNAEYFLKNAVTIGGLLEEQGYHNMFMIGSNASFGGRRAFYEQHGNFEIFDYDTAIERGYIPEDYFVWWGFEDRKLYEYAQRALLDLASASQPFNFNMLTVDTHFVDGFLDEQCPVIHGEEHFISVLRCSTRKTYDFVHWIKAQEFFENTSIVIIADHLSMDQGFINRNVDPDFTRTMFNTFINSSVEPIHTQNRTFTQMDFFPTILASMGISIEGERLGLGTNLFSDRKTLAEEMGLKKFDRELAKNSRFYNDFLLFYR